MSANAASRDSIDPSEGGTEMNSPSEQAISQVDRMPGLHGVTVLVTGGTRGLGRAIAQRLCSAGARVAITGRNADEARDIARDLAAGSGVETLGIGFDARSPASCEHVVNEAALAFGRLDMLVNNAGVALTRWACDVTEEDWDLVQDTNLKGVFFTAQAAARRMLEAGGGVILNVASVGGLVGDRAVAPYCASKGGVVALTRALALEWAPKGIRVLGIAPAYFESDMNRDALMNPQAREHVLASTPMGRLAEPEEVAATAVFLLSPAASYMTGCTVPVDGGWTSR